MATSSARRGTMTAPVLDLHHCGSGPRVVVLRGAVFGGRQAGRDVSPGAGDAWAVTGRWQPPLSAS